MGDGWRSRQKIISTVVTHDEEAEFSRIVKTLDMTRSRALRQLLKGVVDGTITLTRIAKTKSHTPSS